MSDKENKKNKEDESKNYFAEKEKHRKREYGKDYSNYDEGDDYEEQENLKTIKITSYFECEFYVHVPEKFDTDKVVEAAAIKDEYEDVDAAEWVRISYSDHKGPVPDYAEDITLLSDELEDVEL